MKKAGSGAGRTSIVDTHGHIANFFGSDAPAVDSAGYGVVDGSALTKDLEPSQFGVTTERIPDYFYIIPEVDPIALVAAVGTIAVQLLDQEEGGVFTFSAVQTLSWAGFPMPYRIKKVYKTGTTGDFSIIW
jgi:hypothetical protein